ncbi:MAG: YezD family protein [Candidatus Omnitrophica bacterium]|nr:YezD family protein [Candidatus Omnitrophota bacterium]
MSKLKQKNKIKQVIINEIALSLQKIEYGEVVITVHNAKVVQIETREKKRFQD